MGHEEGNMIIKSAVNNMVYQEAKLCVPARSESNDDIVLELGRAERSILEQMEPEILMYFLLKQIGENPDREGLLETPKRWVKFMKEFLQPQEFKMTTFDSEGMDEMIIVDNIPFYSFCEHHIAPIAGYGAIAYIPDKKIVGLSKLPRTLDMFAHRLQNQERITMQTAEYLMEQLHPKGVAVSLTAKHYCMEMRGVKKHDTYTTTTKLMGIFHEDQGTKMEFLNKIKK